MPASVTRKLKLSGHTRKCDGCGELIYLLSDEWAAAPGMVKLLHMDCYLKLYPKCPGGDDAAKEETD